MVYSNICVRDEEVKNPGCIFFSLCFRCEVLKVPGYNGERLDYHC